MPEQIFLSVLIFIVAALYAAVGHGGASGYLALMGLFGVSTLQMRPTALLLNIAVAAISFVNYFTSGHFRWKLFYPFALLSVPMSYLGSFVTLDPKLYKQILAVCLILSVLRILGVFGAKNKISTTEVPLLIGLLLGAAIGFVSGIIGIGGGILLSPLILLFNWASLKETAAVSSLFILVNSIAGIFGLWQQKFSFGSGMLVWILCAVAGGLIGAYWGSKKAPQKGLKQVLAGVLLLAAVKLFFV